MTRNMANLFAAVRAYREAGVSAYAYSGGYQIPPETLTASLKSDLFFIDEFIGAGEVAIADKRAPEPEPNALAQVVVDAYIAGLMTKKAGVTRIHVGSGDRRLATLRKMMAHHEILPESLYLTHLDRSQQLMDEAIAIAKLGCFVDFDTQAADLASVYLRFLNNNGRTDRLSFSSDAGISSPKKLWFEVRKCVTDHHIPLEQLIEHLTLVPAKALKLHQKGRIAPGLDADLVVIDQKDYQIRHVISGGRVFLKDYRFIDSPQSFKAERKADWYGIDNSSHLSG